MITSKSSVLGSYKITEVVLGVNDILDISVANPTPTVHTKQNSMVVRGSLEIKVDSYIEVVDKGQSAKFTPNNGQGFPAGTHVYMKALEPSTYLCAVFEPGGVLTYQEIIYSDLLAPPAGVLVVPTEDFLHNGAAKTAGTPVLAEQGDTISASPGVKIGVFTPS